MATTTWCPQFLVQPILVCMKDQGWFLVVCMKDQLIVVPHIPPRCLLLDFDKLEFVGVL